MIGARAALVGNRHISHSVTAKLTGMSVTKFWSCVDGIGGSPPQFTSGQTLVLLARSNGTAFIAEFGNLAAGRGWAISITNNVTLITRPTSTVLGMNASAGWLQAVAISINSIGANGIHGSLNGLPVVTATMPVYTPANSGDMFKFGKTDDAAQFASEIYYLGIFSTAFSDADLLAASQLGIADDRYNGFEALASRVDCTFFWGAKNDWAGGAGTSTSRGSSPLVLTQNSTLTRTEFTEVRRELVNTDIQDSAVPVSVSGSGLTLFRRDAEYASVRITPTDTKIELDGVSTATTFGGLDQYTAGAFATSLGASQGLLADGTRHSAKITAVAGTVYEFVECEQASVLGENIMVQAIRYPSTLVAAVSQSACTDRAVLNTDSIWSGIAATLARNGAGRIMRANLGAGRRITFDGFGGYGWFVNGESPTVLAARLYAKVQQGSPAIKRIILQSGFNDTILVSGATYGAFLQAVMGALYALDPTNLVYVMNLSLTSTTEVVGAPGIATDFRNASAAAVAAFSAQGAVLIDQSAALLPADLASGPHPNNGGHVKLEANARVYLDY